MLLAPPDLRLRTGQSVKLAHFSRWADQFCRRALHATAYGADMPKMKLTRQPDFGHRRVRANGRGKRKLSRIAFEQERQLLDARTKAASPASSNRGPSCSRGCAAPEPRSRGPRATSRPRLRASAAFSLDSLARPGTNRAAPLPTRATAPSNSMRALRAMPLLLAAPRPSCRTKRERVHRLTPSSPADELLGSGAITSLSLHPLDHVPATGDARAAGRQPNVNPVYGDLLRRHLRGVCSSSG